MNNLTEKKEINNVVNQELIKDLVLNGDISKMSDIMKVEYYNTLCHSLSLNPVTRPFQIISFQGKSILYAAKDCTDQLRKINGVSIVELITDIKEGLIITRCKVQDKHGRFDIATGAVVMPTSSVDKCNAIMKSETKSKRRATLSICGLGVLDESELDTMPKYETSDIVPVKTIETKSENPFEQMKAAGSLDEVKKIWTANKSLQKDDIFHSLKEEMKNKLNSSVKVADILEAEFAIQETEPEFLTKGY